MKKLAWLLYIIVCLTHGMISSHFGYGLGSWERWATLGLIYITFMVAYCIDPRSKA